MSKDIVTPECRASYCDVFAARKNDLNGKMEYGIVLLFPKSADLSALKAAAAAVLTEKFGADQSKWPTNMHNPFRKNSERWKNENGKQIIPAGYEDGDAVFITAKSQQKPGVVDANVQDIIDSSQFYSGCYVKAAVRPFYYDQKGNKGVSFGLQHVQKIRDGDPLGGRSRPSDVFEAAAAPAGGSTGAASVFD